MNFYLENFDKPEVIVSTYYEKDKVIEEIFEGKEGELVFIPSLDKNKPHNLYFGLGNKEKLTNNLLRNNCAKLLKKISELKFKNILIEKIDFANLTEEVFFKAMVEGLLLTDYDFKKYKSDNKEEKEKNVYIDGFSIPNKNDILNEVSNIARAINNARDMIVEPTNNLYPEELARRAMEIAKESGFKIEVLEEDKIKELGMEAFLTVSKGTNNRPRLIVMEYNNGGDKDFIGLVGKGLTCDTGGYSIKSHEGLQYMKSDMSGAAYVIAIMSSLAKNKCKVNVKAVVATCENVVDGNSYKPGDVVKSMKGKTIEVLNTDAEGRLTLADALHYIIDKQKVSKVIDMATLTGLAGSTFGSLFTPIFSNNDEFYEKFMETAKETGEDFWRMPLDERYRSYIDSDVADMKNTGSAGTITASMFLKEFVGDTPWIHLDIAATAIQWPVVYEYSSKGASGVTVRTIYELINKGV
ncbi:leucyl aminopeptidase [uncultured Tyzzerella sp.]|uniref:leucyl aminopeptidase n=1 Tax=uncultured Tyzzerella sp. TaxID=2321398 RepID=UPI002942D122|nr:leucyl aminopeptidase [uncultured Tyzzerella sp.]